MSFLRCCLSSIGLPLGPLRDHLATPILYHSSPSGGSIPLSLTVSVPGYLELFLKSISGGPEGRLCAQVPVW